MLFSLQMLVKHRGRTASGERAKRTKIRGTTGLGTSHLHPRFTVRFTIMGQGIHDGR